MKWACTLTFHAFFSLFTALNMVYGKANSVQAATVNAPSWIHKYIIGRKGANIKQITQDLSKVGLIE